MNLSAGDIFSLSLQNLITAVSSHRPWPEFLSSLSSAASRAKTNFRRFRVNYALLTAASIAVFMIGDPTALVVFSAVAAAWLLLYSCRDLPLVLHGRHVSDRVIIVSLTFVSLWALLWFTHSLGSVALGVGAGVVLCGVHAVVRNPDDLFADEQEAVSSGFLHWS
ncbi:PREDICTED: PRA1 family protein G1 [Tarenaya hassleriana]|uniref:PRA1 family protein G1 n=1 Tax=Tarenaya hassleriana TaxID=28532 RepID=UPI00053C9C79|nr:PREDICTED: PRA1 family protein G1 [Tarenaya hassleriana]